MYFSITLNGSRLLAAAIHSTKAIYRRSSPPNTIISMNSTSGYTEIYSSGRSQLQGNIQSLRQHYLNGSSVFNSSARLSPERYSKRVLLCYGKNSLNTAISRSQSGQMDGLMDLRRGFISDSLCCTEKQRLPPSTTPLLSLKCS